MASKAEIKLLIHSYHASINFYFIFHAWSPGPCYRHGSAPNWTDQSNFTENEINLFHENTTKQVNFINKNTFDVIIYCIFYTFGFTCKKLLRIPCFLCPYSPRLFWSAPGSTIDTWCNNHVVCLHYTSPYTTREPLLTLERGNSCYDSDWIKTDKNGGLLHENSEVICTENPIKRRLLFH